MVICIHVDIHLCHYVCVCVCVCVCGHKCVYLYNYNTCAHVSVSGYAYIYKLCITIFSLGDYREQSRHHVILHCISHCPLHNHIKMLLGNQRYADRIGFHNTLQVKQFKLNTCTCIFSRCRGSWMKFVRCLFRWELYHKLLDQIIIHGVRSKFLKQF